MRKAVLFIALGISLHLAYSALAGDYGPDDYQQYGMLFDKARREAVEELTNRLFNREQKDGYYGGEPQKAAIRAKVKAHFAMAAGVYSGEFQYQDDAHNPAVKRTNEYLRDWRRKMPAPDPSAKEKEREVFLREQTRIKTSEEEKDARRRLNREQALQQYAEMKVSNSEKEDIPDKQKRMTQKVDGDLEEFIAYMKERSRFDNRLGVFGYCWDELTDSYVVKSKTCHYAKIQKTAGKMYDEFRSNCRCSDRPKMYLIRHDGTKKELGIRD
ncbi:hypothetical protein [Desulfomonile tiedjei]|uniref:Uncharacterized protein n=1 Tax=Desulfomonile tiedjei (strain ATCC 49306 / DSM 6799 / DCB-1) TaxID=706587 RepID=I4CF20_DESTA|nr:hypothetical protein [Desulfomonile tiedjei]AFM28161.1 hypothetical protein Desti_5580 [Desulfomonile tiedjei DSM 6799]